MKHFFWAVLLISAVPMALAFSPGGPIGNNPNTTGNPSPQGDSWQTPSIGYNLGGDIIAPKNIGQQYRRNTPVLYYACDANFISYFDGIYDTYTNGTAAIDAAFAVFNNLTNIDSYSRQLNEFPLQTTKYNYTAQALGLTDLKSTTMSLLMEEMSLADPERYVWTLHDRYLLAVPNAACPQDEQYVVTQRNLDPFTQTYSSYINGVLYTYTILEDCGVGAPPDAVTEPYPVDQTADPFTTVAGGFASVDGFATGTYFTGLTRDDVGGLRYLISTNYVVTEDPTLGVISLSGTTNFNSTLPYPPNPGNTNTALPGYGTYDLGALLTSSYTNDPVTLETLFPGVIVASTETNLVTVTNYQVVAYFTNYPGAQAGTLTFVVTTNAIPGLAFAYYDTFANIVTNHYYPNTTVNIQSVTVGPIPGSVVGSPPGTNITSHMVTLKGVPSGDYYILPTNNLCGLDIVDYARWTNVVYMTNSPTLTNLPSLVVSTNTASTTNSGVVSFSYLQTVVQTTNYIFTIHPVDCVQSSTNAAGLYEGVGKIQFIRADYDSTFGQYWQPITNVYTMTAVTNGQLQARTFERILIQPDFLISAGDLAGPLPSLTADSPFAYVSRSAPNWDQNNAGVGLAGPGTINPPTKIIFNDVGTLALNGNLDGFSGESGYFLNETNQLALLAWGSYDGSTNPPVVYPPSLTALSNLENQIIIQVSPVSLPSATNNVPFPRTVFTATGGANTFTAPFTWSWSSLSYLPGSGLPSGLNISTGGVLSGTPVGNAPGVYDFSVILTDVNGRSVQWNYSITIVQ